MEEKYVNLEEALHRISTLRVSRDDFDDVYCSEHERLLLKMIESVNETVDQCIKILYDESKDSGLTITIVKD